MLSHEENLRICNLCFKIGKKINFHYKAFKIKRKYNHSNVRAGPSIYKNNSNMCYVLHYCFIYIC